MSTGRASVEHLDHKPTAQNPRVTQWEGNHEYHIAYPNRWAFIRGKYLRDFAMEFFGKCSEFASSYSLSSSKAHSWLLSYRYHDDYNVRLSILGHPSACLDSNSRKCATVLSLTRQHPLLRYTYLRFGSGSVAQVVLSASTEIAANQKGVRHKFLLVYIPTSPPQFRDIILSLEVLTLPSIITFALRSVGNCHVDTSLHFEQSYISIAFGYAIGVGIGIWVAAAGGGHINPAVRITEKFHQQLVYVINVVCNE